MHIHGCTRPYIRISFIVDVIHKISETVDENPYWLFVLNSDCINLKTYNVTQRKTPSWSDQILCKLNRVYNCS
jgi:hypothetical protein